MLRATPLVRALECQINRQHGQYINLLLAEQQSDSFTRSNASSKGVHQPQTPSGYRRNTNLHTYLTAERNICIASEGRTWRYYALPEAGIVSTQTRIHFLLRRQSSLAFSGDNPTASKELRVYSNSFWPYVVIANPCFIKKSFCVCGRIKSAFHRIAAQFVHGTAIFNFLKVFNWRKKYLTIFFVQRRSGVTNTPVLF